MEFRGGMIMSGSVFTVATEATDFNELGLKDYLEQVEQLLREGRHEFKVSVFDIRMYLEPPQFLE
jgi:hypothetical protein